MNAKKKCAVLKKAHFFKLVLSLFFILFTFESVAHTVVLSEYKLKYENDQWTLYFKQKTSALRDAIYTLQPELKGKNLNSEAFLKETSSYITDNFVLKNEGDLLEITPIYMNYEGLIFEARFTVEGLPKQPDYVTIETSGFDAHEHSVKILSIYAGDQGYIHDFNAERNHSVFSFETKQYSSSEKRTSGSSTTWIYVVVSLIILVFFAQRYRQRQVAEQIS